MRRIIVGSPLRYRVRVVNGEGCDHCFEIPVATEGAMGTVLEEATVDI